MKSNTIKTVLVTLMVVMIIWLLAEYGEKLEEEENKYNVETSTSKPAATEEPTLEIPNDIQFNDENKKKDEIINGITQIVSNNYKYTDVNYSPESDTLHVHIGQPSITSTLNKIPYNTKLKEKWTIDLQPALKDLNDAMINLFRKNNYQTHVALYYHAGYRHENIVLGVHDGKVVYDQYLNIDIYGVNNQTY